MAVVDPSIGLLLAAGSEIDPQVLIHEVEILEQAGHSVSGRLWIDGQATVLEPRHIEQEGGMHEALGSTGKGVGAARAERLMRKARTWEQYIEDEQWIRGEHGSYQFPGHDTLDLLRRAAREEDRATCIIEGTQGYGLGLHAGYYPYCTSSDCRSIDFLAMVGIDPRADWIEDCHTWLVCRTFPIRVAGNSGPLRYETSWDELFAGSDGHIQPEKTTVTKKIRRVGYWEQELVEAAFAANGGEDACSISLTFADYIIPSMYEVERFSDVPEALFKWIDREMGDLRRHVQMITTGPRTAVWL
jgi:adenylosuccinate synthase